MHVPIRGAQDVRKGGFRNGGSVAPASALAEAHDP